MSISFSPDGEYIASSSQDRTIRLWNALKTGEVTLKLFLEPIKIYHRISISFSPNGKQIASVSSPTLIQLWNVETGKGATFKQFGRDIWVGCVAFSPDGMHIAAVSIHGIELWNV